MQHTAIIKDIGIDKETGQAKITLLFENKDILEQVEELQKNKIVVEIKKWFKKRSKNANAYLWALIEKLSQKLNLSRKETYRKHIYEAGTYQDLLMPEEAMQRFTKIWEEKGLGWFCEKAVNEYGEIVLRAYFGSSTYNTKEMTRLLDSVIQDCKSQNIETKPQEEIDSLLRSWGNEQKK